LFLQLLAIFLAMLALAGPRVTGTTGPGQRFVLAIDDSASMSATDVAPSRLAAAKEAAKRVISAMEAVIYGKQLMLPRDAAERKASDFILARFEKLYETLRPSDLHRWAEQSHENASHPGLILLTGFPRSGTTLLEQVLDGHPQDTGLSHTVGVLRSA
jgi:hypothetical protein